MTWVEGLLAALAAGEAVDKDAILAGLTPPDDGATWDLPAIPARPGRSARFHEQAEPPRRKRSLDDPAGRLRFLHAIHHIEVSAIDLAVLCCLRGSGMPAAFHRDFLALAREEAVHAGMVDDLLTARGFPPGSAGVHHRLWDSALACADLGDHLVVVPRVLEARGLDVSASILDRIARVDPPMHGVLDRIYRDEIGHVGTGTRWHDAWCAARGLDPATHFAATARRCFGSSLRTGFPLDLPGRTAAGFRAVELAAVDGRTA
jgi:uncharacterized ferritin-like protein (DUF455 family)